MIRHALVGKDNVAQVRLDETGITIGMSDGTLDRPFFIPWDMMCHAAAGIAAIMPPGSFYRDGLEKGSLDLQKIRSDSERR